MQGNLLSAILALLFYLTSGMFGGHSNVNSNLPPSPVSSVQSIYPRAGTINSIQANLRSQPATNGPVVATLAKGKRVVILDASNNWYRVETDTAQKGWLAKWTVTVNATTASAYRKVIAGYYVENYHNDPVSYQSLSNNLGAINMMIPFAFSVDQYGSVSSALNHKPMNLAKSSGAQTLALVNNIKGGNFNSNAIHRMLTNPSARSRAVNAICRILIEKGFQGVNIDFENVPSRDQIYVTAFFRELAMALHSRNLLVTASLPAKTYDDNRSSHSGAFNYKALSPYLDFVVLMTYDEHYSGGPAGPVASYPWVEKVVKYARQSFSPNKIVLGLAAYGYDWSWSSGKALHYRAIQKLITSKKITPKWSSQYKVPYFSYKTWGMSHQVWYEDRFSIAAKMQLVRNYGLRGVAVWRLGYEDPGIWQVIQQGF